MMPKREYLYDEPFFLQWHITDKCSLKCLHCYNADFSKKELSLPDLLNIFSKYEVFLKNIGRKGRIQFSGGEPFLSPHIFTLLNEAKNKNIPCRILSNGVGITKETVDKLIDVNCRMVQVSIEGDKTTHDYIRGEGSFEKSLESMEVLTKAGIEVTVNMTLSKMNISQIDKVANIASLKAKRFSFSRLVPIGKAELLKADTVFLTQKEMRDCFKRFFRLRRFYRNLEFPLRDPLWHEFLHIPVYRYQNAIHGCSIGFNGLTVDVDGTIYPCRRLPVSLGNILETDFIEIWRNSIVLNKLRNRDLLQGKCRDCKRRWLCGGCRAVAYAVKKNYLAEDPQCFRNNSLLGRYF